MEPATIFMALAGKSDILTKLDLFEITVLLRSAASTETVPTAEESDEDLESETPPVAVEAELVSPTDDRDVPPVAAAFPP